MHPNIDYHLSNDYELIEFLEQNFINEYVDLIKSLKFGVMKADLWRLATIYINGGIYADIDAIPKINFENWDYYPFKNK